MAKREKKTAESISGAKVEQAFKVVSRVIDMETSTSRMTRTEYLRFCERLKEDVQVRLAAEWVG